MPIKAPPFPSRLRGPLALGGFQATAWFTPAWIVKVRITQQFVEVVHSGSDNRLRVTHQFVEAIHSGSDNRLRVTHQFVEVIHTFGTPPVSKGPGNSGNAKDKAPGQIKKEAAEASRVELTRRAQRERWASDSLQSRHRLTPVYAMPGTFTHAPPRVPTFVGPAVKHVTRSI